MSGTPPGRAAFSLIPSPLGRGPEDREPVDDATVVPEGWHRAAHDLGRAEGGRGRRACPTLPARWPAARGLASSEDPSNE